MKLITTQQSVNVAGGLTSQEAYEGQKVISGVCGVSASIIAAMHFAGKEYASLAALAVVAVFPVPYTVGAAVGALAYNFSDKIGTATDYLMARVA